MPETSNKQLGFTILKNTSLITIGSFILKGVNLLFTILVVRRLGDDRFGQYSIVLAFVGLFQIFAELGISQFVMREIARHPSKTREYFWNLVTLRMVLAVIGIIGITIGAQVMGYSPSLVLGVFIMTVTFLIMAFEAPLETILTAHARFEYITLLQIVSRITFILLGSAFLFLGWSYIWLIIASLVALIPMTTIAYWAVRRNNYLDFKFEIDPKTWGSLISHGLPFGIISLTLAISYGIDTVMLSKSQPAEVVGWYRAAYNLIFSMLAFSEGFRTAIVPSLSRTYAENPDEVEWWYFRTVRIIAMVSIPLAAGGMVLSYPMIHLFYGAEFLPSAFALQIIIWDIPFVSYTSLCGNITTIVNLEKQAARIYGAAAIANVAMNAYAITHFGLIGACLSTVLTDFIATVLFYSALRGQLKLPQIGIALLKISIASGLMAIGVHYINQFNFLAALAGGVVIYCVLIILFRLPDQTEINLFARIIPRVRNFFARPKEV